MPDEGGGSSPGEVLSRGADTFDGTDMDAPVVSTNLGTGGLLGAEARCAEFIAGNCGGGRLSSSSLLKSAEGLSANDGIGLVLNCGSALGVDAPSSSSASLTSSTTVSSSDMCL